MISSTRNVHKKSLSPVVGDDPPGSYFAELNWTDALSNCEKYETYSSHFQRKSKTTIIYVVIGVIYGILVLYLSLGYICIILDYKRSTYFITTKTTNGLDLTEVRWDEAIFSNYWNIVYTFYCWIIQAVLGFFVLFFHTKDFVHFFNYWNRAIQVMKMDMTPGLKSLIRWKLLMLAIISLGLCLLFIFIGPVRASCGLISCLILRLNVTDLAAKEWFLFAQIFGFIIVLYGYVGSRALMLHFMAYSLMLTNGARIWNERLKTTFSRASSSEDYIELDDLESTRGTHKLLLKDYKILVQLFKKTEMYFGDMLKSYYFAQYTSLIFEILYLYTLQSPERVRSFIFFNQSWKIEHPFYSTPSPTLTTASTKSFDFGLENKSRSHQLILQSFLVLLLTMQTTLSCCATTLHAHKAYEEGFNSFQIVRKRGLMLCTTKAERNFIHTIVVAYVRKNPFFLSAGGYFTMNKRLLVGVVGSVCSYLVIIVQFFHTSYILHEEHYRLDWGYPKELTGQSPGNATS